MSGLAPPKPVCSFGHFGFDDALLEAIRKSEYSRPTPIQAQVFTSIHSKVYTHNHHLEDYLNDKSFAEL